MVPVVALADAVVHKWAVVIEHRDTIVAVTTVRSALRPKNLTGSTIVPHDFDFL